MARIALLIQEAPALEDGNYLRFARRLDGLGQPTDVFFIDSLRLDAGRVSASGFAWQPSLTAGRPFPACSARAIDHDIVWLLGLGARHSFLDKYQLLFALPEHCRLVNSLGAVMHLRSKYFLAGRPELFPCPETHASPNADQLIRVARNKGGRWIVKPPAGSLGRDVFVTDADDNNLQTIVRHLCGPKNTNYTLLQRYVPEIEAGEKRVIIAGGGIIDQYRRLARKDHRTNLAQNATALHCSLTAEERQFCACLAGELRDRGALFAGADLAYPWLIEVNVINPGGLTTIEALTGVDHSERVVRAVLDARGFPVTPTMD